MSGQLSSLEVELLCQSLVYQVAYAFYDSPYILIFKMLLQLGVCQERALAEKLGVSPAELRKYIGTLYVHRLVKRYVNKERVANDRYMGPNPDGQPKTRDITYWYLDYREFANVTKYRIAMMRKGIDDKVKQDVGHKGYICPNCGKTFDPLDLSNLFDSTSNAFVCDACGTELVEHDESTDPSLDAGNQDQMQRFNVATAPIRDALKQIEGSTIPSLNIVAWVAQNIKSIALPGDDVKPAADGKRLEIVVGADGDEIVKTEQARLADAQRTQNALPIWHTHSTVTGSATALGIKGMPKSASALAASIPSSTTHKKQHSIDDADIAAHFVDLVEEDDGDDEFEDVQPGTGVAVKREIEVETNGATNGEPSSPMLKVGGVSKFLAEITDDDQERMTPDEYQAWYEAMETVA